jgi:hypothetical protein
MALSAADRKRRSRAHNAGEHALCDPARCPDAAGGSVTSAVTYAAAVTPDAPAAAMPRPPQLGARGRRLWREVCAEGTMRPTELVLLEEACRLADRLDRLDRILRGDDAEWMRVRPVDDGQVYVVVLDKALAEARQQAATVKQILAELRASRAATPVRGRAAPAGPPAPGWGGRTAGRISGAGEQPPAVKGGRVADLAARIAARRPHAAG